MGKSLKMLNNVERAKIIAQLFPELLSDMVDAIEKYANHVIGNKDRLRGEWQNGLMPFDFWLGLAENLNRITLEERKRLIKRPASFADQLFDGYNAIFAAHALLILTQEHKDDKLKQAINLYFGS